MLKSNNPDKEHTYNVGQKWTDEEEKLLLDELSKNITIEVIAQSHKRTIGGINARRREIAYKMHSNNISMEEIISKTKLNEVQILETIKRRKYKEPLSVETEIIEMKKDIKEMKKTLNELVEMMKAVYEFEDA